MEFRFDYISKHFKTDLFSKCLLLFDGCQEPPRPSGAATETAAWWNRCCKTDRSTQTPLDWIIIIRDKRWICWIGFQSNSLACQRADFPFKNHDEYFNASLNISIKSAGVNSAFSPQSKQKPARIWQDLYQSGMNSGTSAVRIDSNAQLWRWRSGCAD